mmetsp:Transcript_1875/g.7522  ORF Transcript_1875/g.7522 Transcript_1875/m.7522 type:complete len:352 (-) Transcript_1875:513-1568(-)
MSVDLKVTTRVGSDARGSLVHRRASSPAFTPAVPFPSQSSSHASATPACCRLRCGGTNLPTDLTSSLGAGAASSPSRLRRCMPLGASTLRASAVGPTCLSTVMVPVGLGAGAGAAAAGCLFAAAACSFFSFSSFSRRSAFFLFVSREPPSNSRRSLSLYSSNDPLNTRTYPGSGGSFSMSPFFTCQISSTTSEISRSSCDTSTTPPSKLFSAIASASMVSRSRWFVGSSRSRMSGCARSRRQMATRRRSPPERFFTSASPGGHRRASIARSTVLSISHAFVASSLVCSASMRAISLSMSQSGSVMSIAIWLYSSMSFFTAATPTSMFSITVSPSSRGGSWGRYPTLMPSSR